MKHITSNISEKDRRPSLTFWKAPSRMEPSGYVRGKLLDHETWCHKECEFYNQRRRPGDRPAFVDTDPRDGFMALRLVPSQGGV